MTDEPLAPNAPEGPIAPPPGRRGGDDPERRQEPGPETEEPHGPETEGITES